MPRTVPEVKTEEEAALFTADDVQRWLADGLSKEAISSIIDEHSKSYKTQRTSLEISYKIHERMKTQRLPEFEKDLAFCEAGIRYLEGLRALL